MPPKVVVDFDRVTKLFELPIETAAAKLGVCVITLKKVCRRNGTHTPVFAIVEGLVLTARTGVLRWPYRPWNSRDASRAVTVRKPRSPSPKSVPSGVCVVFQICFKC
jgi:hypothetical protein